MAAESADGDPVTVTKTAKLTFLDLPAETQQGILSHVGFHFHL
jgi:hypothetical protein